MRVAGSRWMVAAEPTARTAVGGMGGLDLGPAR